MSAATEGKQRIVYRFGRTLIEMLAQQFTELSVDTLKLRFQAELTGCGYPIAHHRYRRSESPSSLSLASAMACQRR